MANYDRLNQTGLTTMLNRIAQLVEPVISILPISKGGTGNADGYIRTGKASNTTAAEASTIEGVNNTVEGKNSHAEGNSNTVNKITEYPNADLSCHVEGYSNTMTAQYSHAEGANNTVTGATAHAEGMNNTVSQQGAHAEGRNNTASGYYSHAEGAYNTASSYQTHVSGSHNVAAYENQTVIGTYNSNKSNTLFEVGNGNSENETENRSNAFEVYADGHVNAPGGFYKNGTELVTGVSSFNSRTGAITPTAGDYDATQVNYDNNQTVKQKIDALVTKEASDIAGQQSLFKDTVGWTGKNLLPYPYVNTTKTTNGITFTVNSDGSVTANGTATGPAELKLMNDAPRLYDGRYILNGCPEGGKDDRYRLTAYRVDSTDGQSGSVFDTGNGVEFTYKNHTGNVFFNVYVHTGTTVSNLTFYPMLRRADITDPTYEPYHESVEVMYEEEIHGVNLLENTAVSKTENGITFTVNADGSVTVNGTATADTNLILYDGQKRTDAPFKNIPVILSKGSGASVANTSLYCNAYQGTTYVRTIANCQGILNTESDVFEVDYNGYDGIRVGIKISNGVTLSNAVFRPMIRKADIEDSTYRPYNQQSIQHQINDVRGVWTTPVSCLTGDTTATITNSAIHTTSTINLYIQTASGATVSYSNLAVTEGQAVITFGAALTEAASVKLQILNV